MNISAIVIFFILSVTFNCFCDSTTCVPPCRPEYICKNGECVSKCNPPCPSDLLCGGELGCITKDQYEDLTDTHYGKIFLTSALTLAGIGITVISIVIEHNQKQKDIHPSKSDILASRIFGPTAFIISIPLNLLTWNKYFRAKKFREKNNLQPR
jgi:hypothetical protein